eukprot:217552-Rhodomonas_salina.1
MASMLSSLLFLFPFFALSPKTGSPPPENGDHAAKNGGDASENGGRAARSWLQPLSERGGEEGEAVGRYAATGRRRRSGCLQYESFRYGRSGIARRGVAG